MSDNLMFQEYEANTHYRPRRVPFMVRFLMEHSGGRVTTETQANTLLVLFASAALLLAVYFFHAATEPPHEPPAGFRGEITGVPVNP
ncbi:MAG TPA: hypothetical protein VFS75_04080 [Candidatus Paceibacterota bacterium]|nr:hypothetical protein [Candidatus Paceibacterota bacterium]